MKSMECEIKFSAVKNVLFAFFLLLAAFLMLLIAFMTGVWMHFPVLENVVNHEKFGQFLLSSGMAALFLFGIVFVLIKLFSRKPAILINEQGLYENVAYYAVGFIPWEDVDKFSTTFVQFYSFLVIRVKNPKKYIARGNFFKRALKSFNSWFKGTPIVIPVLFMQGSAENIERFLADCAAEFSKQRGEQ